MVQSLAVFGHSSWALRKRAEAHNGWMQKCCLKLRSASLSAVPVVRAAQSTTNGL